MEVLQWTMSIPRDKQDEFVRFYDQTMRPTWLKFGATKCELFKTFREKVAGQNSLPEDQFVEMLYLEQGLTAEDFFNKVKAVPEAWEISRQYEKRFGAKDIVMRVLQNV
jgi:hypothetical protein